MKSVKKDYVALEKKGDIFLVIDGIKGEKLNLVSFDVQGASVHVYDKYSLAINIDLQNVPKLYLDVLKAKRKAQLLVMSGDAIESYFELSQKL